MKQIIFKSAGIFAVLALSTSSFAAKGTMGRAVGAGLTFPSSHQSIVTNSGALSEAAGMSIQGLYGLDTEEPAVSLVGSQKSFGWGLGWRDSGTTNKFDAGLGINLGGLLVGTNLFTTDFDGIDGDVSATIDLSKVRITAAFRGIDDGVNRFDLGLGFNVNSLLISLDMYKYLPWSSNDSYVLDASFAYNAGSLSVGVGYDFIYDGDISNGDLHADISLSVTKSIALEGHYRINSLQATYIPEMSVGARVMF